MSTPTLPPNEPTHHWPLSSLYLCEDCQRVSQNSKQCEACSSKSIASLDGLVNRDIEKHDDE